MKEVEPEQTQRDRQVAESDDDPGMNVTLGDVVGDESRKLK